METLTKENFWDEMEQKYPKATAHFKEWVDKYKTEHDWDRLFGRHALYVDGKYPYKSTYHETPKYHELPIAMQFGIFIEWYFITSKSLFPGQTYLPHSDNPKLAITACISGMEYWFERSVLP